jgi:hypothetical protein
MIKGITSKKEIKTYRSLLKEKLSKISTEVINIRYSSPAGISDEVKADYSEDYEMWWYFDGKEDQYWNPFGLGKPNDHQAVTGRCQINMPKEGLNRRVAGSFAKDESGQIYLLHNGKIGGGKTGISKKTFIKWYSGELLEVDFDGEIAEYFIVAEFDAPNFYEQIRFFVQQVYDFKELNATQIKTANDKNEEDWLLNEESTLRNPFSLPAKTIVRGADHAIITNALLKELKALGHDARRNKSIDVFIVGKGNKLSHIFEVKSSLSTQTLYTAIGQLMVYGVNHKAKHYLVVDKDTNKELLSSLSKLDITPFTFSWVNKKPVFKKLTL